MVRDASKRGPPARPPAVPSDARAVRFTMKLSAQRTTSHAPARNSYRSNANGRARNAQLPRGAARHLRRRVAAAVPRVLACTCRGMVVQEHWSFCRATRATLTTSSCRTSCTASPPPLRAIGATTGFIVALSIPPAGTSTTSTCRSSPRATTSPSRSSARSSAGDACHVMPAHDDAPVTREPYHTIPPSDPSARPHCPSAALQRAGEGALAQWAGQPHGTFWPTPRHADALCRPP